MNEIESIIHAALKGDGRVSPERRIIEAFAAEGYVIRKDGPAPARYAHAAWCRLLDIGGFCDCSGGR